MTVSAPPAATVTREGAAGAAAALAAAMDQHRTGRLDEAAAAYRRVLDTWPDTPSVPDALQLLGAVLTSLGRAQAALPLLDRALRLAPGNAPAHNHRGLALAALGRLPAAAADFAAATRHMPGLSPAWVNLAATQVRAGRFADAIEAAQRALVLDPGAHAARTALGIARLALGDAAAAVAVLSRVPRRCDAAAEARLHLGHAWRTLGRTARAERVVTAGRAAWERRAGASAELGTALLVQRALLALERGAGPRAERLVRQALAAAPDDAPAACAHARVLCAAGRAAEAAAVLDATLARHASAGQAWRDRGQLALGLGDVEGAQAAFRHALQRMPTAPGLRGQWLQAKLKAADWSDLDASFTDVWHRLERGEACCDPFPLLLTPATPALQVRAAAAFQRRLGVPRRIHDSVAAGKTSRLRVAYVSGDWHDHPTMQLLAPVLRGHDRHRVEVIAVALGPIAPGVGATTAALADRVVEVGALDDAAALRTLRGLDLQIAVDLNVYTRGGRPTLFARGIAPLQLAYLGHPGVAGDAAYDYAIVDPVVATALPVGAGVERALVLPGCYLAGGLAPVAEAAPPRSTLGLPDDAVVVGCTGHSAKILPPAFEAWMHILRACPQAVLWLRDAFGSAAGRWHAAAAARGVDPGRLITMAERPRAAYRAALAAADLFVDTWPYNGHTTGLEVLSAGVPLVTRVGEGWAGRVGASLLRAAGLPELVAHDDGAYVARGMALVRDPAWRAALRARLVHAREGGAPLFDVRSHVDALERGMAAAWRRRVDGRRPARIEVAQSPLHGALQNVSSLRHSPASDTSPGKATPSR